MERSLATEKLYICFVIVFAALVPQVACFHPTAEERKICTDYGIWYADGSLYCDQLATDPRWSNMATFFCTNYSQTYCCKTCTQLGYPQAVTIAPGNQTTTPRGQTTPTENTTPSIKTSTTSTTTSTSTTTQSPNANCVDEHVWIADSSVLCRYLRRSSPWGIDKRALYYCNTYKMTYCCQTCALLNRRSKRRSNRNKDDK